MYQSTYRPITGFNIIMHYGGKFVHQPELMYVGGKEHRFWDVDLDTLSTFELRNMFLEVNDMSLDDPSPSNGFGMYYILPGGDTADGLFDLQNDSDIRAFAKAHVGWLSSTVFVGTDDCRELVSNRIQEGGNENNVVSGQGHNQGQSNEGYVGNNETAAEWLLARPKEQWARAWFPVEYCCDTVVNNGCESFNRAMLELRDKPIITMLDDFRSKLMEKIQEKRLRAETWEGSICPDIMSKLKKNEKIGTNWHPRYCGRDEYQVESSIWSRYVVDLAKRTCTCGFFQQNQYPCIHAACVIREYGMKKEDYVDRCYTKEVYLQVYNFMIHAVPGPIDYVHSEGWILKPPIVAKKTGRPKKKRIKGPDEVYKGKVNNSGQPSTRKGGTITCKKCLQKGHNRSKCRNDFHPKSPLLNGLL